MKLRNLAAIATVIGAIFAALTYFSGKNNEVDTNVPNRIKKQADKLELSMPIRLLPQNMDN